MNSPDLCDVCGGVPIDEKTVLQTEKYWYRKYGDCSCNDTPSTSRTPEQIATQWEKLGKDTEDQPDEPIGHDYHRELHQYLVEKGEREE
jgi:hypothetical protein